MSKLNETQPVAPVVVVVPPLLADAIDQLVVNWAKAFGADDRRSVEIAIVQRGIRAVQAELREALEQGERNGWSEHSKEESVF
jgi:hypothetical protein